MGSYYFVVIHWYELVHCTILKMVYTYWCQFIRSNFEEEVYRTKFAFRRVIYLLFIIALIIVYWAFRFIYFICIVYVYPNIWIRVLSSLTFSDFEISCVWFQNNIGYYIFKRNKLQFNYNFKYPWICSLFLQTGFSMRCAILVYCYYYTYYSYVS